MVWCGGAWASVLACPWSLTTRTGKSTCPCHPSIAFRRCRKVGTAHLFIRRAPPPPRDRTTHRRDQQKIIIRKRLLIQREKCKQYHRHRPSKSTSTPRPEFNR